MLALIAQVAQEVEEVDTILDAQTIAMISGLVIPLLVGLLSKINASSGLKGVLNATLSTLAGVFATVTQVDTANVRDFVIAIGSTWIVSVATYYGVWKPTGLAGSVAAATARFGVGSPPALETDDKGMEDLGEMVGGNDVVAEDVVLEGDAPDPSRVGPGAGAEAVF